MFVSIFFAFLEMPNRGLSDLWMLSAWFIKQQLVWITCAWGKQFLKILTGVSGKNILVFHSKSLNIIERMWNTIKCTVLFRGKCFNKALVRLQVSGNTLSFWIFDFGQCSLFYFRVIFTVTDNSWVSYDFGQIFSVTYWKIYTNLLIKVSTVNIFVYIIFY